MARVRRALETIVRVVCLVALGAVVASAQPAGRLTGVVRDTTGGLLPGVTVTVTGAALIAPRTVITDEHGEYVVDALPAGRYLVTAAFSGFEPSSVEVDVGATSETRDVVLAVPSLAESVTVTATKTGAADVQSTPIAITVLPATALDQMGVHTVEGLAGVVPTVTISQHTGLAQVTIRGIGTNSTFGDPSSTVHLDGVYLGRPSMVFADFLNVERVEVLRGPQGTLYGRNSVGGTINIVTKQPSNTLETSVRLTAGNYDELRAEGAVSGPLIKNKVMGNFAILRGTREGFVKDLDHPDHSLGSEDTWAGRGQLRVVLGTHGELLLSGDRGQYEGVPLTYAKPLVPKPDYVDRFDNPPSLWRVRTSDLTSGKNIQQGASAKLTVRLNRTTTLTSLTAYRSSNYRFFIDADATELQVQTSDVPDVQRQVSQELTLVQRTPKLTWIGGAFFFDEHHEGQVEITVYPLQTQTRPFAKNGVKAGALFGQATYSLTRGVSLTGGVRYTDERKDLDNTGGVYQLKTTTLAVPTSFYDYVDDAAYQAWTPKGSIQVQVSRDTFVYVSATRGFKSGGFNQFNPTAPESERAFNPEFDWSFEGGLKRTMASGRVRVNTAVFFNDYRDLQVQAFLRPGVIDVSNAGSATIRGIEVEGAAPAGRGVQIAGHFSWLDATYDRYLFRGPGGATLDTAGNRLNNAPEWSGGASGVYELATGRAGTASVRGDVSWQSRVFFTPVNDAIETQRAYGLLHLRAGFEPQNRRWEIAVYVRNLGKQEYITGTANVPPTAITGRPGDPRQWGTQFTIRP
jgi:iron complex outermembrane recepter protein